MVVKTKSGPTAADLRKLALKAEAVAETLAAMANANRLLILCLLVVGERTVTQIVEAGAITQSAVSQHLARLRLLGLVSTRRAGKQVYYQIASAEVRAIMQTLYATYCAPQSRKRDK